MTTQLNPEPESRVRPLQFNGISKMSAVWYGNDHTGQAVDYKVSITKDNHIWERPFRVHFLDRNITEMWTEEMVSQFENWKYPRERIFFKNNFLSNPVGE